MRPQVRIEKAAAIPVRMDTGPYYFSQSARAKKSRVV